MKTKTLFVGFILASCVSISGQNISHPIPQWLKSDWEMRAADGGIWITDNKSYQSDQEPYDTYGLEWKLGLGNNHLTGRLFCMQEGVDIGTVWSFTEFWDPEEQMIKIIQIGSDGTVGQGSRWQEENGITVERQSFVSPSGTHFETGHRAWLENGEQHTQSYNIVDETWTERRKYLWKRNLQTSQFSTDFDSLMGTWKVKTRQLKVRLAGSDEWIEGNARARFWKQLDGMVVMDEFVSTEGGKKKTGSTYRIYNPETKEWTIYWASTAFPELGLIPQVSGKFENGIGVFYGEEIFRGQKVKLRFKWQIINRHQAYWEQAYFDIKHNTWETNWTMQFER